MITKYLTNKSNGILKIEPEALNYGNSYSMFNDAGVEVEVGEFLWALVRILKPQQVFETGTHLGISCSYMAQALKDNGFGKITTIEYNPELIKQAEELWDRLELTPFINSVQGLSYNFQPAQDTVYDLLFLDSEPETRFREFELFYPFLKEGGFVLIHDLNYDMSQNTHNPDHPEVDPWPFSKFPDSLKDKGLTKFNFPTPRGITCFYKPTAKDYKI